MPCFKWRAIDLSGRIVRGKSEKLTQTMLVQSLLSRDLGLLQARRVRWWRWYRPIRLIYLIEYFSYLNTLLKAGVPIDKALLLTAQHINHVGFAKYIYEIRQHVQQGTSLAEATNQYPELFDQMMRAAVAAGYESGAMVVSISLLVEYLQMIEQCYKKMRAAAFLPLITFIFFLIICGVIIGVVMPIFATTFANFGQQLPYSTSMLIAIFESFTMFNIFLAMTGFFLLLWLGKWLTRNSRLHARAQQSIFLVPIIGTITIGMIRLQWLTGLALLLRSGKSLTQGLEIVKQSSTWHVFKKAMTKIIEEVSAGNPLYQACSAFERFFPQDVRALLAVGHESGDLTSMLERAASLEREQLLKKLNMISTVVQPILMMVLGILVAGLIFSVYYPLLTSALTIGDMPGI